MPRRNRRSTPSSSHNLNRFDRWAQKTIEENRGQGQRIINNRKKGGEKHAET